MFPSKFENTPPRTSSRAHCRQTLRRYHFNNSPVMVPSTKHASLNQNSAPPTPAFYTSSNSAFTVVIIASAVMFLTGSVGSDPRARRQPAHRGRPDGERRRQVSKLVLPRLHRGGRPPQRRWHREAQPTTATPPGGAVPGKRRAPEGQHHVEAAKVTSASVTRGGLFVAFVRFASGGLVRSRVSFTGGVVVSPGHPGRPSALYVLAGQVGVL